MKEITREMVRGLLPPRDPGGHKGTFGRVYIYGGYSWVCRRMCTPL